MRTGLFDFLYAFQYIVNVLLERIEPFNTLSNVYLYAPIVLLESIDLF